MSRCPSCGGIIGRDCFNPVECAAITHSMQEYDRTDMEQRFWKLIEIIERHGIDCSELKPKPAPEPVRYMDGTIADDLPF